MPTSLRLPLLQVDASAIHRVDTRNPESIHDMWTVFTRCGDAVAEGRRLENMSWRLWNHETICCDEVDPIDPESESDDAATTSPAKDIQRSAQHTSTENLPQLSSSLDSVPDDDEAVDFCPTESAAMNIVRPTIRRLDSCASSRSRTKHHFTPEEIGKLVTSIILNKTTFDTPLRNRTQAAMLQEPPLSTPRSPAHTHSGSTSSESSVALSDTASVASVAEHNLAPETMSEPARTVVRGFSPSGSDQPTSRPSPSSATPKAPSPSVIPEPEEGPEAKVVQPKKPAKFALGGSSGDDSFSDKQSVEIQSFEVAEDATTLPVPAKKKMFQIGSGSTAAEASVQSTIEAPQPAPQPESEPASKQQLVAPKLPEPPKQPPTQLPKPCQQVNVIPPSTPASDNEQSDSDFLDESAIDDDEDSSDWEDSVEESGKSSMEEKFVFQRVDSKPNLPSRRSLLTLALAGNDGHQRRGNPASQSTSAISRQRSNLNGPSLMPTMGQGDMRNHQQHLGPISEMSRASGIAIAGNVPEASTCMAMSPRTTRRNMLATELPNDLRREIMNERAQKTAVANAVMKRRYTSNDVANLTEHPTPQEFQPAAAMEVRRKRGGRREKELLKHWETRHDFYDLATANFW